MSLLLRICSFRVSQLSFDRRLGQLVCFSTAPVLLFFAIKAVCRFATTPWEIVVGLLASASVSLLLTVVGMLMPRAVNSEN